MFGFGRSATFLLLALLAEIAGTVGGFGSSVFFVPVANMYFDFQSVLGITALFHLASNISKLGLFRGGIDRGLLLRLGVPSGAFAALGGLATTWFPTRWLEAVLAVFLLGLSGWMLLFVMPPLLGQLWMVLSLVTGQGDPGPNRYGARAPTFPQVPAGLSPAHLSHGAALA